MPGETKTGENKSLMLSSGLGTGNTTFVQGDAVQLWTSGGAQWTYTNRYVDIPERSSTPPAPGTGYVRLYAENGYVKTIDSSGTVRDLE